MHWMWLLLGATWLYETGVLVFATLPSLTEWYGDDPDLPPDPLTIKILLLIAVIVHVVILLAYAIRARMSGKSAPMHTWHYVLGVFAYAWPTIATWVWDNVFAASASPPEVDVSDAVKLRGYILWKAALMLAVIAAVASTASAIDLVRSSFKHSRLHPKV
jgi:hypothetical protein